MYAVIMAGGIGSRFWPKSRKKLPKQLINIVDSEKSTLIQLTVKRILPLIKIENIFIVTNVLHKEEIERQLPELDRNNIIAEPIGKNTAPCIGLAAIHLRHRKLKGSMIVLSADHFIKNEDLFRNILCSASTFLKDNDYLLTLGIKPSCPETGYGYIQKGNEIGSINTCKIYKVKNFTEKPDKETADFFFNSSNYFWNCGTFIWKIETILNKIKEFLPDLYDSLLEIEKSLDSSKSSETINKIFLKISPISIDYGVMEKTVDAAVIPCDPGWSDVGSWSALYSLFQKDKNGNLPLGKHIQIDTHNSLISSKKKLIATIGVTDMVIVDTDDAILICHKDRAQEVKDVVRILEKEGYNNLI